MILILAPCALYNKINILHLNSEKSVESSSLNIFSDEFTKLPTILKICCRIILSDMFKVLDISILIIIIFSCAIVKIL